MVLDFIAVQDYKVEGPKVIGTMAHMSNSSNIDSFYCLLSLGPIACSCERFEKLSKSSRNVSFLPRATSGRRSGQKDVEQI